MVISRKTKTTSAPAKTRSIKSYFSSPTESPSTQSSPQSNRTASSTASLQDRIAQRAYDIYVRRGGQNGLDQFDWDIAETLVRLESAAFQSRPSSNRLRVDEKDLEADIQKKAYELFEKRGYAHGSDQFDWNLAKELVYLENKIRP